MREGEPGAVASAPVEEQPTAAAELLILLLPDTGWGNDQASMDGKISPFWTRLRWPILGPRASHSRR